MTRRSASGILLPAFSFETLALTRAIVVLNETLCILCLVVLNETNQFASGSWDTTIKIWDSRSGQLVRTLTGHSAAVQKLVVMPNGTMASASNDKTIIIWEIQTGRMLRSLTGHRLEINGRMVFILCRRLPQRANLVRALTCKKC